MNWHLADGLIIGIAIPAALFLFARAVYLKYRLMTACAPIPDPISDHGARLKEVLTIFLEQKKLFQDFQPGVMHAFIFWGFCVLSLRTVTMFGMAFAGCRETWPHHAILSTASAIPTQKAKKPGPGPK